MFNFVIFLSFVLAYIVVGTIIYNVGRRLRDELAYNYWESDLIAVLSTVWIVTLPLFCFILFVKFIAKKTKVFVDICFAIKNIKLEDSDDN